MTTIKLRRGTATEWTTANPILVAGEMGIETDTRKFKFGDGTTPWNTLAYASAESGGGTSDVTAGGDNTFTGNNTFTGEVNLNGISIAENLTVNRNLTSSGEINAVSIKTTGLRSDDIQTTANKKYLTEVDVDNQTIQVVDGKLHANLDTKQDTLVDGNGTKVVDNKVDINQGNAGIQGLTLYQNNGTITKSNDLSITFDNGACGYIFLENKGVNNDYEIVLHSNYLNKRGPADDCNINGVRCLPEAVLPTPGAGAQGECWFDTFNSPFRVVAIPNGESDRQQTVDAINYIKYIIKGTNLTISYSSTGEAYTELYTIAISSTYVINVCIANSPWQNDIGGKWTNTTLYSDSYILDKTTNTYLMKQGTSNEGVAVATSSKYGLVLPDNSTIVSNNGVISAIQQDLSTYATKEQLSTAVDTINSTKNDNIFDIGKFTVIGNPTITDDGVASGFNTDTNYIQVPINPEGNFILDFEINIGKISNIGSQIIFDALGFYKYDTDWNIHYPANGTRFASVHITENSKTRFIIKKENLTITTKYSVNNGQFISLKQFVLTDNTNTHRYLSIGKKGAGFSIDLKNFSITVDGKEVFNGLMESTKPIYDKITSTNTTLSTFQTDTDNNFSAVNSALNEKANLSDLANYVPLSTYNALLARVEALETKNNGGNT